VGFAGAELRKPAGDGGLAAFEAVGLGVGVGSLAFLAMSGGLAVSASAATAFAEGADAGALSVL
jgi:hypothetical protein